MNSSGSRVERVIIQYFNQLLHGCGDPQCENSECASSPRFSHGSLTPNQAAILAVQLTSRRAPLCCPGSQVSTVLESGNPEGCSMPIILSQQSGCGATVCSDQATESSETHVPMNPPGNMHAEESSWTSLLPPAEVTRLLMLLLRAPNSDESLEHSGVGAVTRSEDDRASLSLSDDIVTRDGPSSMSSSFLRNDESRAIPENLKRSRICGGSTSTLDALVASLRSPEDQVSRTNGLTLDELRQALAIGRQQSDWSGLLEILNSVFSSYEALSSSFPSPSTNEAKNEQLCCIPSLGKQMQPNFTNEDPSSTLGEKIQPTGDVIVDTSDRPPAHTSAASDDPSSDVEMPSSNEDNLAAIPDVSKSPQEQPVLPVNMQDVRLAWSLISTVPDPQNVVDTLMRAIRRLMVNNLYQLLLSQVPDGLDDPDALDPVRSTQQRLINMFLILYECPFAKDPSHFEHLLLNINRAVAWLPITLQARLCRAWANTVHLSVESDSERLPPEETSLWSLQRILLQHITLRCLTTDFSAPNEDKQICDAALVLRIVYYASILAGEMDSQKILLREAVENGEFEELMRTHSIDHPRSTRSRNAPVEDPLEKALAVSFHDCRKPLIPAKDFVNETLNEALKPKRDYANYRSKDTLNEFSFMRLPFLLQTKLKSDLLHYDSRMRMMEEQRGAFVLSLFGANQELPYLKLHVSRDRVIEDTLLALEITCLEKPSDLKKQLLIEFEDEQGVDEGGLSKEFFQLIIEKIFDPVYGMFVSDDELGTYWFNPEPLDDLDREYCLIGILLGLAIYNDIILDVRFPSVLYRKLFGKLGTYEDLKDARPDLIPGLQSMLDYDGDDFEEAFDCNFVLTYQDPFGNTLERELLPDGKSISVTKSNRQEFVDLYADFLLNTSIKKQFTAFRRGFQMVVDESPLRFLFRADEIELLVRGSREYDFKELERVTKYHGYTADSPVIKNFWYVVHNHMTKEQQYQLLQFATGSDRIPAGGMSQMKFTIARQGADPDRLPTAHTCFNILLLPDYPTLEQLQRLLFLAIAFSKGFGMS